MAHAPAAQDPNRSVPSVSRPFERLLVPVDFSAASRTALALAFRMAEPWDAEVLLFSAPSMDENDEFLDHTGVPWGKTDVVGETRDHLRRLAEVVGPPGGARIRIDAARDDNAVRAVARACEQYSPSLVVIGLHWREHRRWRRSRAERIVRAVTCPVMLVRGEREPRADADS